MGFVRLLLNFIKKSASKGCSITDKQCKLRITVVRCSIAGCLVFEFFEKNKEGKKKFFVNTPFAVVFA